MVELRVRIARAEDILGGEIQEMQQKKMVTEEEKRRYFTFSLFSSHMKKLSQVS